MRRTRAALLAAAMVTERAGTEFSVTELAEAAAVSRRVPYQHYGDRGRVPMAVAIELMTRELAPAIAKPAHAVLGHTSAQALATVAELVDHLTTHRRFYRALPTGSCAYAAQRRVGAGGPLPPSTQ